jgi:hypothetical protein
MLTIRSEQMQLLRKEVTSYKRKQAVLRIVSQLCLEVPDVMNKYSKEQHFEIVDEVLDSALKFDIDEPEHLLNWSYIRFLSNIPFYNMDAFKEVLEHPLLHPYAKARHVILAFFAIRKLQQETIQPWA